MGGLIEAIVMGGTQGYRNAVNKDTENQAEIDKNKQLMEMELEMRDQYLQRAAERTKRQNIADLKTIDEAANTGLATESMQGLSGGAGVGSSVSADDLNNLKINPDAVKAYRNAGATGLINASREDTLKAKSDAALSIGRDDYAKDFEGQSKGMRDERRLDQADTREEHRFQQSMAVASRQAAALETQNARSAANERIKVAELTFKSGQEEYNAGTKAITELVRAQVAKDDPAYQDAQLQQAKGKQMMIAATLAIQPEGEAGSSATAKDPWEKPKEAAKEATGKAAEKNSPVKVTTTRQPVRQGRDVTPYVDKLQMLMERQPSASAPISQIKQWNIELANLKARDPLFSTGENPSIKKNSIRY